MSRPKALFTAPHDFLGDFADRWGDRLDLSFAEAWYPEDLPAAGEVEAWLPNPGQHFTVDGPLLERFPALRVISTPSTGSNHIDRDACAARGVAVRSLLDDRDALESISASAEFTFLLLLNAIRRLDVALEHARSGAWRSQEGTLRGRELQGMSVGLVGMGRIGRRLSRWLEAFDANVQAYDPYAEEWPAGVRRASDLRDVFEGVDAVVVCCALTPQSAGLVGGDELRVLRKGAVIVNTSRGEVLDEPSVVAALEERSDLVFAADVVTGEVRNEHEASPLLALARRGRILVTPHVAGVAVEAQRKAADAAARLAVRALADPAPEPW